MMVVICIGNVVAWVAAMYVKGALPGLLGHLVVSIGGALLGAYLSLQLVPSWAGLGMIPAAFAGAILLLYSLRLRKLQS